MEKISKFAIIISISFLVIIIFEVLIKIGESCSRKSWNMKIIKELSLTDKRKIFLKKICKREEVFYKSYILYNALYFISTFLSLEYSIVTAATLLIENQNPLSHIWIPLITLTFTVVNICVQPRHRANQYLLAWRKYDAHTQLLLQQNYENMTEEDILKLIEKSVEFQNNVEQSLKQDEIKDC